MIIKPITGETRNGQPMVALMKDATPMPEVILKAYPNEAGDKLRIIIPSLVSFKQARIDIDGHYIEVEL